MAQRAPGGSRFAALRSRLYHKCGETHLCEVVLSAIRHNPIHTNVALCFVAAADSTAPVSRTLYTVADEDLPGGSVGYRPLTEPSVSASASGSPKQRRTTIAASLRQRRVGPEIEMERVDGTEYIGEDESNKPADRPYYQQTMRAWSPLLTPLRAAAGYLLIGLIFVPLGAFLWQDADEVAEMR